MSTLRAIAVLVLALPLLAFGQSRGNFRVTFRPAVSAANPADADFTTRATSTGVVRAITFSTDLPVIPLSGAAPTAGTWPDARHRNLFASVDTVNKLRSTGGSIKFSWPAEGTTDLTSMADNGGTVYMDVKPDTSATFGSGNEFYVQWRSRKSPAWMAFNDSVSGDQMKEAILTLSDRIAGSDWAWMSSCSFAQLVPVDLKRLMVPSIYYSTSGCNSLKSGTIAPARSGQTIDQTGPGCLHSATVGATAVNISSIQRVGNVTTVVTSTAHGLSTGNEIWADGIPMADPLSYNNTSFDGVFTVTVDSTTQFHFAQAGADQGPLSTGTIRKIDRSKCWTYQPNEWATFELHVKPGSDYTIANDYHRDSVVELWGAHENQPPVLITSVTDFDMVMHEDGNGISTASPSVTGTAQRQAWWPNHGMQPAYGRLELMQYLSNRCPASHGINALQRSGTTWTVYTQPAGGENRQWLQGNGNTACATPGQQVIISGTTVDSGSFNGTWTVATSSGGSFTFTSTAAGDFVKTNEPQAPPTGVAKATMPQYDINCLGGPCIADQWADQVIWSTNMIPFPKVGVAAPVPDPPDHLQITNVDPTTGDVTLQWKCNDTNATGYKIDTCAADRYQCAANTGLGTGAQWTYRTTAAKTCSPYGTQSAVYSIGNNNTLVSFRVHATNANGDSTWSNVAQNTPGQPTNVTAVATSATSANVSWTRALPATETGFAVEICTVSLGCSANNETNWSNPASGSCHGTVAAGATNCDITGLTAGTTYMTRVKAVNNAGETLPWGADPSYSLAYGGNTAKSQVALSSLSLGFGGTVDTTNGTWFELTGPSGTGARLSSGSAGATNGISLCPSGTDGGTSLCTVGQHGYSSVIAAWNSAAADTVHDKFIFPGEGGHNDYAGNEIYSLNLGNPTRMVRLSNPTHPDACMGTGCSSSSAYSPEFLPNVPISTYSCDATGTVVTIVTTAAHNFLSGWGVQVVGTGGRASTPSAVDTLQPTTGAGATPALTVDNSTTFHYSQSCTPTGSPVSVTANFAFATPWPMTFPSSGIVYANSVHCYGCSVYDAVNDKILRRGGSPASASTKSSMGSLWSIPTPGLITAECDATNTCTGTAPVWTVERIDYGSATTTAPVHPPGMGNQGTSSLEEFWGADGTVEDATYLYMFDAQISKLYSLKRSDYSWTSLSPTSQALATDHGFGAIDWDNHVFIYAGNNGTAYFRVSALTAGANFSSTSVYTLSGACSTWLATANKAPGLVWDPVGHQMIGFPYPLNGTYYTISLNTSSQTVSCTAHTATGGTGPSTPSIDTGGIFGRCAYFPHPDAIVCVTSFDQNPWALLLRANSGK